MRWQTDSSLRKRLVSVLPLGAKTMLLAVGAGIAGGYTWFGHANADGLASRHDPRFMIGTVIVHAADGGDPQIITML